MMRRSKYVLNQLGVTLLEILIGTSLLGFIVVAALSVDRISKRADSRLNVVRTLETIRGNLIEILNDREGLRQTVAASSAAGGNHAVDVTMQCLLDSMNRRGTCPFTTTFAPDNGEPPFGDGPYSSTQQFWRLNWSLRPFQIRRADGSLFYDGRVLENGFSLDGSPCTGFDFNGVGNAACPLRMELSWTIECDQNACDCPVLVVAARALFHGGGTASATGLDSASIHPQQHGITALRLPLDAWCGYTPISAAPTPVPTPSGALPPPVRPDDPECATGTLDSKAATCVALGCSCNGSTYLDCPAGVGAGCAAATAFTWTDTQGGFPMRDANGDAMGILSWGPSGQCRPPQGKLTLGPAACDSTLTYNWDYSVVLPQMPGVTGPAMTGTCCPPCNPFVCTTYRVGGSTACCDSSVPVSTCCNLVPQNRTWNGATCGCTPSRPCP